METDANKLILAAEINEFPFDCIFFYNFEMFLSMDTVLFGKWNEYGVKYSLTVYFVLKYRSTCEIPFSFWWILSMKPLSTFPWTPAERGASTVLQDRVLLLKQG